MIIIGNLNEIDVNVETYDGKEIKILSRELLEKRFNQ